MGLVKLIFLCLFMFGMGLGIGFGLVIRRVEIYWYHLTGIALVVLLNMFVFSYLGRVMGEWLSLRVIEVIIGLCIVALGVMLTILPAQFPGFRDLLLLMTAWQLEIVVLSYGYAQLYSFSFILATFVCVVAMACILLGMILADRKWSNWRLQKMLPVAPGILLVLIGFFKVL